MERRFILTGVDLDIDRGRGESGAWKRRPAKQGRASEPRAIAQQGAPAELRKPDACF
jgi:hypothetical protein